jgi:hypothetical protein
MLHVVLPAHEGLFATVKRGPGTRNEEWNEKRYFCRNGTLTKRQTAVRNVKGFLECNAVFRSRTFTERENGARHSRDVEYGFRMRNEEERKIA